MTMHCVLGAHNKLLLSEWLASCRLRREQMFDDIMCLNAVSLLGHLMQ